MLLSLRKTNDKPIANAHMTMRDLMVHAVGHATAVLRISPTNWSGRGADVKMLIEMDLQELKSLRADINDAIANMEGGLY